MRLSLLTTILVLYCSSVVAQDVIVKPNGDEIKVDVIEITTDDVIRYKNYDHLDGPIRNIRTADVFMIIYENGEREIFKNEEGDKTVEKDTTKEVKKDTTNKKEEAVKKSEEDNQTKADKDTSGSQGEVDSESRETTTYQDITNDPRYKDPDNALLWGILIAGGGHFYAGETGTGLLLLGLQFGAPYLGSTIGTRHLANNINESGAQTYKTYVYAGIAVGVAAWIYSIADAKKAARRTNEENGLILGGKIDVAPTMLTTRNMNSGYGFRLKFNF